MSGTGWLLIGNAALCVLVLTAVRWQLRRRARRAVLAAPVTDPFKMLVLTRACGPCTGVQGTRRCTCSGNCGQPECTGRLVGADMASALRRITREGGGHDQEEVPGA